MPEEESGYDGGGDDDDHDDDVDDDDDDDDDDLDIGTRRFLPEAGVHKLLDAGQAQVFVLAPSTRVPDPAYAVDLNDLDTCKCCVRTQSKPPTPGDARG